MMVWAENLMADLRFALRMLSKNPGFSSIAILTLALGIGGTTAVFSYVNAILLKPLPFRDSQRLVMLFEENLENGWRQVPVAPTIFADWRDHCTAFESLVVRGWGGFILTGNGVAENVEGAYVSVNAFQVLGVRPLLGRDFLPEEERLAKSKVVLISFELWQQRFGGQSNIIGRTVTINDEMNTVIGVMPSGVSFPEPSTRLWTPQVFSPDEFEDRHRHMYSVYGRLKANVPLARARMEMEQIARQRSSADPHDKGWGVEVRLLRDVVVGDSQLTLLLLMGAVGMVLLIACANVANLLLVRSAVRSGELATRVALGASRGRLLRQLMVESVLLAILGGIGGILLAFLLLGIIQRFTPPTLPRIWEGVHLDSVTVVFNLIITLTAAIISGLVPAWRSTGSAVVRHLNESYRSANSSRHKQRLLGVLVVSEVALSVVLLTGATFLTQSFHRLLSQDLGYRPEHLLALTIGRPDNKGETLDARLSFFEALLAQSEIHPDLRNSALVRGLPLREKQLVAVRLHGTAPRPGEALTTAGIAQISPSYFRTMGIRLLQGRNFEKSDRTNTLPVVIVDQTFVKNFHLGENPVGRLVDLDDGGKSLEIIGVVNDIKRTGLADPPRGEIYRTFHQTCPHQMALLVRTERTAAEITRLVRAELDSIDKDQPVGNVTTMIQLIESSADQRRWLMQLMGTFAGIALVLTCIGIYGVLAYAVTQRTSEIGIRAALGAQPMHIIWLVLRQGLTLVSIGIAVGLAATLASARVLRSLLFHVSLTDPFTLTAVTGTLCLVALVACYLPVRRAAKVEPMVALRYE
jgi:putative ABC transport system permease protein